MYCWGDDMSNWADPGAYRFAGDARAKKGRAAAARASARKGGRSYLSRRAPEMATVSPRGKVISTTSTTPVVIAVDVTGSMARWPYEIFDRLPLLYQTLAQYRPDLEVCFAAIGDATCDRYPLQVCDFARGVALEEQLNALYGEGGGGGGARESYELFAYYLLRHVRAPEATRPFLIVFGDEGFYPRVDARQVRHFLGEEQAEHHDSRAVWSAVAEAWNVFHLRKTYGGEQEAEIQAQWADALGEERVISLDDPQRAVDLALGLIARAWGRYGDFEANMGARQSEDAVRAIGERLARVEASQ